MHDTVAKIRKYIAAEGPQTGMGEVVARRFEEAGISRALTAPMASHIEAFYLEAHRWLRLGIRFASGEDSGEVLGELVFSSRHLHTILADLPAFLERAEDNLTEREEITHRESAYEREIAPFSRLDSTRELREALAAKGFDPETAGYGAQAEADLMKIVYLERRIRENPPKPADLNAMVVEMGLDIRRHLQPAFEDGSPFMTALRRAGEGPGRESAPGTQPDPFQP
jgi:hypothetical protein